MIFLSLTGVVAWLAFLVFLAVWAYDESRFRRRRIDDRAKRR